MPRQRLGSGERIRHTSEFQTVFDRGRVSTSGPLRVHVRKTERDRSRLGLAVSRRVGNAVRRNRIKRLLRVAFRSVRDGWVWPLDIVIVVLPHEPQSLEQYQLHLDRGVHTAAQLDEGGS